MSADVIRFLLLILIFGTVLLGIEGVTTLVRSRRQSGNAINRRLALIASGIERSEVMARLRLNRQAEGHLPGPLAPFGDKLARMLHGAGLAIAPATVFGMMLMAVLGLLALIGIYAYITGRQLTLGSFLMILTFALIVGMAIPLMLLSRISDRRRKKIEAQFPVALDVFVRGLRAGHPVASALELLTTEMVDPIGSEFGLVVDEVTYGADLSDALQGMADRWGLQDMQMFVVCLSVQRETGGNLAEILENLASVIRDRASMYMKVRALSSEGRMTAIILSVLPLLAFSLLFVLNPGFFLDVSSDPIFIWGFGTLIVLYLIGYFTIRRMVNLEV